MQLAATVTLWPFAVDSLTAWLMNCLTLHSALTVSDVC